MTSKKTRKKLQSLISKTKEFAVPVLDDFRNYVESENFEEDLDELGTRLGVNPERMRSNSDAHWTRVRHKITVISGTTGVALLIANLGKPRNKMAKGIAARIFAPLMTAMDILIVGEIAFHCYDIFIKQRPTRRFGSRSLR